MIVDVEETPAIALALLKKYFMTGKRPFRHPGPQPGLYLTGWLNVMTRRWWYTGR